MGYDARWLAGEVVASGLSVAEWCAGSAIGKTSVYRALNWCRVNDPSVFGAGERAARESDGKGAWYAGVMRAAAGEPAGPFVPLGGEGPLGRPAGIVVEIGAARVTLPAGAAAPDVEAAVSAVARAVGASS